MSEKFRIEKLIDYITNIIEELNSDYLEINADWLGIEANNYSIDKIPTDSNVESWIIPCSRKRDVYTLRSRENYSSDLNNNLQNIGFFEKLEKKIRPLTTQLKQKLSLKNLTAKRNSLRKKKSRLKMENRHLIWSKKMKHQPSLKK